MPDFPISGPFGVVLMLLLSGIGAPFPEELVLIGAGVAAHPERAALFLMMTAGWAGVVGADFTLYCIGRFLGARVLQHKFLARQFPAEKRERFELYLSQKGARFILLLRFMTGLRAPAYFSAGAMRYPAGKFLFYDGLAALVSVPLMCVAGFALGKEVKTLQENIGEVVLGLIGVALVGFLFNLAYRKWRARSRPEAT